MKGWKTWTGAIGIFGSGLAMIADGVSGEQVNPDKVWQGICMCFGAFAAVGIGHKIEKS